MMASNIMTSKDKKLVFSFADTGLYRTLVHNMFSLKQSFFTKEIARILRSLNTAAFKLKHDEFVAFSIQNIKYSVGPNTKICTVSPQQAI